jgi:hypothetical protein
MGRSITNHRKRLLRLLRTEDLEALRSPEMRAESQGLLEAIAQNWSPEIEQVIRKRFDAYIVMAQAEHSIDIDANKARNGLAVVKK